MGNERVFHAFHGRRAFKPARRLWEGWETFAHIDNVESKTFYKCSWVLPAVATPRFALRGFALLAPAHVYDVLGSYASRPLRLRLRVG